MVSTKGIIAKCCVLCGACACSVSAVQTLAVRMNWAKEVVINSTRWRIGLRRECCVDRRNAAANKLRRRKHRDEHAQHTQRNKCQLHSRTKSDELQILCDFQYACCFNFLLINYLFTINLLLYLNNLLDLHRPYKNSYYCIQIHCLRMLCCR